MEVSETHKRIIRQMEMISKDMEAVARDFDRKPFSGRTAARYFGYHGAAISVLADAIKFMLAKGEKENE